MSGFLLFLAMTLNAETIQFQENGAVLEVSGDQLDANRKLRLSGTILLRVHVDGGNSLQVEMPDPDIDAGWKVIRQSKGEKVENKEGLWRWSLEMELEPVAPVKSKLPTLVVRHRQSADSAWKTSRFEGETIEVLGPEGSTILGTPTVEPLPGGGPSSAFPLPPIIGGLILVVLLGTAWWWWRRPVPISILPPDEKAIQELERLGNCPPEEIHARVSIIVRRFVEERFGVLAPRQTSEEIIHSARENESFPPLCLENLEKLLIECDHVKFTGTGPTRQESASIVTRGCQWIRDSCNGKKA